MLRLASGFGCPAVMGFLHPGQSTTGDFTVTTLERGNRPAAAQCPYVGERALTCDMQERPVDKCVTMYVTKGTNKELAAGEQNVYIAGSGLICRVLKTSP